MTATVWVLGDQLNRRISSLAGETPDTARVLLVESAAKLASKRWHPERRRLVLGAMRAFADELRSEGFEVDHRQAPSLEAGLAAHRAAHRPQRVVCMEPMSWDGLALLRRLEIEIARSNQFLCHYDDFAAWAAGRRRLVLEDFYRHQRVRLGYLMDGDEPAGGRWNFDRENRAPPPDQPVGWPEPPARWPLTRAEALERLGTFVREGLPRFGRYQDAMVAGEWALAHSLLSPALNLGLLFPEEVCDAVEAAYREGAAPVASAEGFIRQVIGWREYVWGVYWLWMPDYRELNALGAVRPLPPALGEGRTEMRCVRETVADVREHGYAHHIQRLMVLGNLGLLAGISPPALVDWMWRSFVDGAEWVMLPNVLGMALHADGGRMATKPYAAGGAYISRMSDYCGGCRYDPRRRTGEDACPFTTLYWDFLARHRERLLANPRVARQVRALDRLRDLPEVRGRAGEVLSRLEEGTL